MRLKIDWASPIVGRKFTVFALFYFVFEGNFLVALRVWGAYIWRGLYMEGLIFGILRYTDEIPTICKPEARKSYPPWVESPRIGYPTRVGYSRCSNRAFIARFTRWPFRCSFVQKTPRIESSGTEQLSGKQV